MAHVPSILILDFTEPSDGFFIADVQNTILGAGYSLLVDMGHDWLTDASTRPSGATRIRAHDGTWDCPTFVKRLVISTTSGP